MRTTYMLEAAAAVIFSVQTLSMGVQARVEMPCVDPENYVSKEVAPEVSKGGIQKLYDQGVLRLQEEDDASNVNIERGNLRSLQHYDDDTVLAEEVITIEYYQDNRFSPVQPIYSHPLSKDIAASGNKWLYANTPLQPIFGINDLPIQGLTQGYCENLFEDQDGYCRFTYEFFDVENGAITVYASITAEGNTAPQGPSILTVLGGTGEFSGAAGTIILWPVGIDESLIPARIFRDGSLFLGNPVGYEMKMELSVRYLLNAPVVIPVPVNVPIPAIPQSQVGTAPATGGETTLTGGSTGTTPTTGSPFRVTCPGQVESEYCDCDLDCGTSSPRCQCAEAQVCCEQR